MDKVLESKLTSFFQNYSLKKYKKGQSVIWAGEEPPGIIFLESGNVGQFDISEHGQKIMLNIFKPSAFFPMSWAINKNENLYFFEALTDVRCRIAPASEVVKMLHNNNDITVDLLSRVYRGTDGLLQRIAELMVGTARSRLILELLISANRFGKIDDNGSVRINIKTTELAQRTGLARETISRELKKLEQEKIITHIKSQVTIKDLALLSNPDH